MPQGPRAALAGPLCHPPLWSPGVFPLNLSAHPFWDLSPHPCGVTAAQESCGGSWGSLCKPPRATAGPAHLAAPPPLAPQPRVPPARPHRHRDGEQRARPGHVPSPVPRFGVSAPSFFSRTGSLGPRDAGGAEHPTGGCFPTSSRGDRAVSRAPSAGSAVTANSAPSQTRGEVPPPAELPAPINEQLAPLGMSPRG